MIDYEKLEKVHALYPQGYLKIIPIFDRNGALHAMNYSMDIDGAMPDYFFEIETLIATLEELVKPEPKYKVGELVWLVSPSDGIVQWRIERVDMRPGYGYRCSDIYYSECEIFPTRQALIEYQLQHWQKLYNEQLDDHGMVDGTLANDGIKPCDHMLDPDNRFCMTCHEYVPKIKCEHESDKDNALLSNPMQWKCIKCGEFYR